MPNTYFILASENEISQLKSVEEVLKLMDKKEPLLGGECFSLEAITNLCQIFLKGEKVSTFPTKYFWKDGSKFYGFNSELCEIVALTEWDDILNASIPWSESEPWKSIEHNRMDLAGMIIDFAALCKQTSEEKQLYFLLSNED